MIRVKIDVSFLSNNWLLNAKINMIETLYFYLVCPRSSDPFYIVS